MRSLRQSAVLAGLSGPVSVRQVALRRGLSFPLSLRQLVQRRPVRVEADVIVNTTADGSISDPFNTRDEVYLAVVGQIATEQGVQADFKTKVPGDYFGLHKGEHADHVLLWEGELAPGQHLGLSVIVREQDNTPLDVFRNALSLLSGVGTILSLVGLASSAKRLYEIFKGDGDKRIGGLVLLLRNQGGELTAEWDVVPDSPTSVQSREGLGAEFRAQGDDGDYTIRGRVSSPG